MECCWSCAAPSCLAWSSRSRICSCSHLHLLRITLIIIPVWFLHFKKTLFLITVAGVLVLSEDKWLLKSAMPWNYALNVMIWWCTNKVNSNIFILFFFKFWKANKCACHHLTIMTTTLNNSPKMNYYISIKWLLLVTSTNVIMLTLNLTEHHYN